MPEQGADGPAARRRSYRPLPLLPTEQRHLASRFSFGVTPAMAAEVRRAGGARAWFDEQLAAPLGDRPADETLAWFPTLRQAPREAWNAAKDGRIKGYVVMADYQRYAMVRRIRARHQVREVMTEFWEQLLNVPTTGEPWFVHRRDYGDTLRKLAFTSYENILRAAVLHPSMLVYLDNARSTAAHPNENLGRELLELHTVGRGNYDEAQVKDSARILTGWAVDTMEGNRDPSWVAWYSAKDHWTGPVRVLGFSAANDAADGKQLTYDYLRYLAHHPLTAQRLARRLVTKFVGDEPDEALVARIAQVYLDSSTAIVPVLRALVDSPEFARSRGAKVRDPAEDVVATYRVLQVALRRPTGDRSAANTMIWQSRTIGLMGFSWPRPDGAPIDNATWSTPGRLLSSYRVHQNMSGGYYPTQDCRYRPRRAWLPRLPVRFDQVVDHLSRQLLHQKATPALVRACAEAADVGVREPITPHHRLVRYGVQKVIVTMLDSPDFFLR